MPLIARLFYYLGSIPTLLAGVRNWGALIGLVWPRAGRRLATLELRKTGLRFRVRSLMDAWILKEAALDHDYERASVPLQDGWQIIDIGAGLGDFAIDAARRLPHSRVVAVEPFPESFALLQHNVRLNGLDNLVLLPFAVGTAPDGQVTLYTTGAAVQHRTAAAAAAQAISVACKSLSQIVDELPGRQCDYLKLDCEGAEFEILLGVDLETLARVRHICLEYHDGVVSHSHADLVRFFQSVGFAVRRTPNPVHSHLGFLHAARLRDHTPAA